MTATNDIAARWSALSASDKAAFIASLDEAGLMAWDKMWRAECASSLLAFAIHVMQEQGRAPAAHHRLVIKALQSVSEGSCKRLMIFMPPGSAKTWYATRLFPAWWFAQHPRTSVICASHTATLAESFSADTMRIVRDHSDLLGYAPTTERVDCWATTNGCTYIAVGCGGGISGRRADLAIIDDPVRNRADADSETVCDRIWSWYNADLQLRLKPDGRVILIQTRWSEGDLAGRLLEVQKNRWTVISLPALAEEGDPLGRKPGEPLWSDDSYGYGAALLELRDQFEKSGGMRDWWSLYQQSPQAPQGNIFDVSKIARTDIIPECVTRCRAWDLAATSETGSRDADYTAGVLIGRTAEGRYVVIDAKRARLEPAGVEQLLISTAEGDGPKTRISLPRDPGQAGKSQIQYLIRQLAGYDVHSSPETGDKSTRAAPLAAQVNAGNVSIVTGDWNRAFLEELAAFPSGRHDDFVDAAARSFARVLPPANPIPKFGPMVFVTPRGDAWAGGGADYAPVVQIGGQHIVDPWRYR